MLRILAFSDIHVHDVARLEAIAAMVQPDLILFAGGGVGRFVAGPGTWAGLAAKARFGLAGVLGDTCGLADTAAFAQPRCHDLHAAPLLLDGLAILGLQGSQIELRRTRRVQYTGAEADAHLARQAAAAGDRKLLLVSHAPPHGVLDEQTRRAVVPVGASAVLRFLDQSRPVGIVCGNAPDSGGNGQHEGETLVVNVATRHQPGAALRYATLTWNGTSLHADFRSQGEPDPFAQLVGLGPNRRPVLHAAGFHTLDDLLAGDGRALATATDATTARRLRAQARALQTGEPVLLDPSAPFPPAGVFIQVETSYDRQDDPWLVGWQASGDDRPQQRMDLNPKRLQVHLSALTPLLPAAPERPLVQWASYERGAFERAFRRLLEPRPPWVRPRVWFSASEWAQRVVALPIHSGSLRAVASYFGYRFAHPELDRQAVGKLYTGYRMHRRDFDDLAVRAYNADQLQAMAHVVRAIQALAQRSDLHVEAPIAHTPPEKRVRKAAPTPREVQRAVSPLRRRLKDELAQGLITKADVQAQLAEAKKRAEAEAWAALAEAEITRDPAVRKWAAAMDVRVRRKELTPEARDRAVVKYARSRDG